MMANSTDAAWQAGSEVTSAVIEFSARVIADAGIPRVELMFGQTAADADCGLTVTMERRREGEAEWFPIRGLVDCAVPYGGKRVIDWEHALNAGLFYRALVKQDMKVGGAGVPVFPTGIFAAPLAVVAESDTLWLQGAVEPNRGVAISSPCPHGIGEGLFTVGQAAWPQPVSESMVMGSALPVISTGVRSRTADLPVIFALDHSTADAVRELFHRSGTILLRGLCDARLTEPAYFTLADLAESQDEHLVEFSGTLRLARPISHLISVPFTTYDDVHHLVQTRLGSATYTTVMIHTPPITYSVAAAQSNLVGSI
ncbi:MAG: hypothetical protein LBH13_06645 [Cellulomonadaceae bacterium]|jgi:hypothetical protein|nr:hypothetical protein [Cellulomonadaceae bacterium]